MRGEIIHQIYIADGFEDDCDALVHRCLRADRLNYESFCEIWKEMKFDTIYTGRSSLVEIAELSEELVHTAKRFMMAPVSNFEENVAGLFLVYALVNLQPYPGFAVLRLVPDDVPMIKRIEMIARRERRHDVLYILGAVLIKHSQFHAEQRERGMDIAFRKYSEGYIGIDSSGFRPRGTFYRQIEELDVIRELAAVQDRYVKAKKDVTGGKSNQSLSFINQALPNELDASLKRIISGVPGMDEDDEIDEADVHYSKVQAIKEKAMRQSAGAMRHLTSAAERSTEKSESPNVSEIKSKPGKVKTSSPTKTFLSPKKRQEPSHKSSESPRPKANIKKTTNSKSPLSKKKESPKVVQTARASTSKPLVKRKLSKPKRKMKKAKRYMSESSSDSDINISDLEKGDSDDDINSDTDFDLTAFDKPKPEDGNTANTQIEIEIDELPAHVTSEKDGMVYEIEIIDKLGKSEDDADKVNRKDEGPSSSAKFKKPVINLSRLGILPVSDFACKNNKDVKKKLGSRRGVE